MIEIPDPTSTELIADWIELDICLERRILSRELVSSFIEQSQGEEPTEAFISSIWRELSIRQGLYYKPIFIVEETTVIPQNNFQISPVYVTCLLLSLYGVQGETAKPANLFERITALAIKQYVSGEVILF